MQDRVHPSTVLDLAPYARKLCRTAMSAHSRITARCSCVQPQLPRAVLRTGSNRRAMPTPLNPGRAGSSVRARCTGRRS
jgi:hypothetical protein